VIHEISGFTKEEKNVKKGLIVYLIDSDSLPQTFDGDDALAHLSLRRFL